MKDRKKLILPGLALIGFLYAVKIVVFSGIPAVPDRIVVQPSRSPYESFIAGIGIVEASSENIAVSTNLPGVVSTVFVVAGQKVKAGDPLFLLDQREYEARLQMKDAMIETARAEAADAQDQLQRWLAVKDKGALSVDDLRRKKYAAEIAAGKLHFAEADAASVRTDLDRLTVRSPVDGEVLQIKVRVGEYAQTGALTSPLVMIGTVDTLHVRVDVDENDAWRAKPDAPAIALVRGNPNLSTAIRFVRFEPYVVPKRSLSGESTERVDTRVLQVLYSFQRESLPVFVGQLVDVFIEAPPIG